MFLPIVLRCPKCRERSCRNVDVPDPCPLKHALVYCFHCLACLTDSVWSGTVGKAVAETKRKGYLRPKT